MMFYVVFPLVKLYIITHFLCFPTVVVVSLKGDYKLDFTGSVLPEKLSLSMAVRFLA